MLENKILCLSGQVSPAYGSTVKRLPLQPTDHGSKTADWLSPTGLARSLPTNIRDIPHTINTNSIRSKRTGSFATAMGEGGSTYSASTNVDNFVEERADKSYSHGNVPSIVRCKKMYQTEAMERQNEALPAYKDVLAAQGLAAKLVPGQDHRSRHRVAYAPDYVNYAGEGFIRGTAQNCGDATAKHAQGAAWVGTAPVQHMKSVQSTMLHAEKAEFQKNHPSASGRIKVIVGCTKNGLPPPSATLDRTLQTCRAGEVHASKWKTMYQTEICKMEQ